MHSLVIELGIRELIFQIVLVIGGHEVFEREFYLL